MYVNIIERGWNLFILGKSCLRNFQIQVNFDNFRLDIAKG